MKNANEDFVFEDFDKELVLKWSPDIKSAKDFDKSNYVLAQLLTWSKSFNIAILEARNQLDIVLQAYPKDPTPENLAELYRDMLLSDNKKAAFDKRARAITEDFRITENWILSVELAILTGTLLVPSKDSIKVHLPDYFYPEDNTTKGLANKIAMMREGAPVTHYPAIYFTRRVTVDELKRWINENKSAIRAMQFKLPKPQKIKRGEKTLFWGYVAWLLKRDGFKSWAKMTKAIEQMINRQRAEFKSHQGDHYTDIAPEPVELEKYYNRFMTSLKKLQPSNKSPIKSDG